jgi:hypothetical protein
MNSLIGGGPNGQTDPGKIALIQSLLGLGGGIVGGIGQAGEAQKTRDFTAQQNTQNQQFQGQQNSQQLLAQMLTNQYNSGQSDLLSRDKLGMDATQLDPLAQQKARGAFALQGDKVSGWTPTTANFDYDSGMGGFQGGYNSLKPSAFTKSLYTPEAMMNAEMNDFQTPLQRINPGAPVANAYGAMGADKAASVGSYGADLAKSRATADDNYTSFAQQLSDRLAQQEQQSQAHGPAPAGYEYDKKTGELKKKGHGILGKIGGVLKMAAPIAAMAIPGLGPVAAMALAGGGTAAGSMMQGQGIGSSLAQGGMSAFGTKALGAGKVKKPTVGTGIPGNNNASLLGR